MSSKVLPKFLTVGQLHKVAATFNPDLAGEELSYVFIQDASVTRPGFIAAVKEMAGEENIGASDAELMLNEEQNNLAAQLTACYKAADWEGAADVHKKMGDLAHKRLNMADLAIEERIVAMYGKEVTSHKTHAIAWGQEKSATREWSTNFGFPEADTLILFPVNDAGKVFQPGDVGKIAVAVPENGNKKVLHVARLLEPAEADSTFFKRVAALVGKPEATNGVNSTEVFDMAEWKVNTKKMVRLN